MSEEKAGLPAVVENKRPTTRAGREAVKRPGLTAKRVKRRFRKILSSRELYNSIQTIIKDPDHRNFPTVLKTLLEYADIPRIGAGEEGDDNQRPLAPTALPALVHRKEVVREVYNEAGELVKRFGKSETTTFDQKGRKTSDTSAEETGELVESTVEDSDYTVEDAD